MPAIDVDRTALTGVIRNEKRARHDAQICVDLALLGVLSAPFVLGAQGGASHIIARRRHAEDYFSEGCE